MGVCSRSTCPGSRRAYPGVLAENPSEYRSGITGEQEEEPQNKANAGDATVLSVVRGGRKAGSFAERQQMAEGAPLIRNPFVLRLVAKGDQATQTGQQVEHGYQ